MAWFSSSEDYFAKKHGKLRDQFESEWYATLVLRISCYSRNAKNRAVKASELFRGVSIWVNGYTQPSAMELRSLIGLHGGNYESMYVPSRVTHVIATTLPNAKLNTSMYVDYTIHSSTACHSR
jgi:hypothetical protein